MKTAFISGVLCCASLVAQAQTTSAGGAGVWDANHFLWFTGHWGKAGNKRIFVIDKGNSPAGGTITFNPEGTVSLNNSSIDEWNKRMDQALDQEQKYLKGLQDPGANLDPTTFRLHQLLIPDAQERVQDIKGYKMDPSADMLDMGNPSASPAPSHSLADNVADYCKTIKPTYDEVMNYYNTQVNGHKNDLKYPNPPVIDYDCYSCDSNLRKQYDTTTRNYVRDFAKDEIAIARKGFGLLHDFALVGINTNMASYPEGLGDLFSKNKKDASKSGACSYIDVGLLSNACYGIAHHVYLRAEKMMYDNRNNYKAAQAIILTYLQMHRSWCLISGQDDDATVLPVVQDLLHKDIDHYLDELRKNDWRQVANFPLMLSLIRDEELMGNGDAQRIADYYKSIVNIINSFKMTVDMDVKIGVNNGYKLAHLKGECHIIPSFQQDENQCYKWVIADENRREYGLDGNGFYMAKDLQNFDATLVAAQVVGPGPMPTYSGTKKYTVHLASLSMDFCHPGNDTIDLSGFTANPPEAGTWVWPGGAVTSEGVIGMEQYFEDVNSKKKFANDGEAKKAKDDLRSQAEKLRVQMDALKAQMAGGKAGGSPGASYEKMMEFKQQAMSKVAAPVVAKLVYLNFLLPVQNDTTQLVKGEFDARKINPQEANVIIYGYYRINIVNHANGK